MIKEMVKDNKLRNLTKYNKNLVLNSGSEIDSDDSFNSQDSSDKKKKDLTK